MDEHVAEYINMYITLSAYHLLVFVCGLVSQNEGSIYSFPSMRHAITFDDSFFVIYLPVVLFYVFLLYFYSIQSPIPLPVSF